MSGPRFVPIVGLIGGVGSGKSTLARSVARRQGVQVIDGDAAGHQVLKLDPIKQQIRRRFGDDVFDQNGEISRPALGRRVFGLSPEQKQARADLEAIVHPAIREVFRQQIDEARRDGQTEIILLDAAVLLESGWDDLCHAIVFVDVPDPVRWQRVQENRGWDEDTFRIRESNQLSLDTKRQRADFILPNSQTIAEAGARLQQILSEVTRSNQN